MNILTHTRLGRAKYSCPDLLDRLKKWIVPAEKEKFASGVENEDADKVNEAITGSLQHYLDDENELYALENYLARFGIEKELSFMPRTDIVKCIADEYYGTISGQLKAAGVPAPREIS